MKTKTHKLTGKWKQYLWEAGEKSSKWQFRKMEKLLFEWPTSHHQPKETSQSASNNIPGSWSHRKSTLTEYLLLGGRGGTYTRLSYFKRTIINMKNFHNWRLTLIIEFISPNIGSSTSPMLFSTNLRKGDVCWTESKANFAVQAFLFRYR